MNYRSLKGTHINKISSIKCLNTKDDSNFCFNDSAQVVGGGDKTPLAILLDCMIQLGTFLISF